MNFLFWRRKQRDKELDEELQSHLRMATRDGVERGESSEHARDSARREMGNVALVKETTRDIWGWRWLADFAQDVRYGMRMLKKNLGFTAIAVLTMALGIGVNTSLFTAFHAVAMKMIPVEHPQNVVRMMKWFSSGAEGDVQFAFSYPEYLHYREHAPVFSGVVAASWPTGMSASLQSKNKSGEASFGGAMPVAAQLVSENYFSELGIHPVYGQTFGRIDKEVSNARPVAVIGYQFWRRAFGASPQAIGAIIKVNGTAMSVIGVAPERFTGTANPPIEPDFWAPLGMQPQLIPGHDWRNDAVEHPLQLIARLAPGTTSSTALPGLGVAADGYRPVPREYPESEKVTQLSLQEATYFGETHDVRFQEFVALLMVVTGLVLLIACANLANMLLARASGRQKEISTRMALGASRGRVVRQLLTESTLLAMLGGAVGLIFSIWASNALWLEIAHVMEDSLRPSLSTVIQMDLNLRVFAYTVLLSLVTGTLFGLFPALRSTKSDLTAALKDEGNAIGGRTGRSRMRSFLVAAQMAGSMLLLITAGLMSRGLIKSQSAKPGFNERNVFALRFDRPADAQRSNTVVRQIADHLGATPEIENFCIVDRIPFTGTWTPPVIAEGSAATPENNPARTLANYVSPAYFATLEIPILRGRTFNEEEIAMGTKVAIVSRSASQRFWPGEDPIGRRVKLDLDFRGNWTEFEVVGVAKDVRTANLSRMDASFVYVPINPSKLYDYNVLVRPRPDVINNPASLGSALRSWEPEIELGQSLESFLRVQRVMPEAIAKFAAILAVLAVLLAAVGIYGVMAYLVSQRRREIGIRVALGAMPGDILRVILAQGLRPVFAGGLIGLLLCAGLASMLRAMLNFPGSPDLLFGVSAFDPETFVGFTLLLAAVALLACYVPARRALKVDPMVALRYE
nr:ABC transporter permease [Candidatus Acidoferrales bacterium]